MSRKFSTYSGNQLYRLLPEVYRHRDNGDLALFLDACGELLDRMHRTLEQRLTDCFPDIQKRETTNHRINEDRCQDWILPYFADLLDVQLVSPESDGRREEVAKAINWRQSKGTLACIEQISQSVAQTEVEIQEGWKRVAVTARIGLPLLPHTLFGETGKPDMHHPLKACRHPGLPAVTVDFRFPSRSVKTDADNPAAHRTMFAGTSIPWRQVNPHGAPCFPGSYNDVSKRTVDLRTPDETGGHFHLKRVLLFAVPPDRFFGADVQSVVWANRTDDVYAGLFEEEETEDRFLFRGLTDKPLRIRGIIDLDGEKTYCFERVRLDNTLIVHHGRLELQQCAARAVEVHTIDTKAPVLKASDVLFSRLQAARGLVQLEYCTVLEHTLAEELLASDCIFIGAIKKDHADPAPPQDGCIRFSRIPIELLNAPEPKLTMALNSNTTAKPIFFSDTFGEEGCGTLHPATSDAIRSGAEDGGETGAYHGCHYVLRVQAVIDKLKTFLPFGMEAVWIYDDQLSCAPPRER